MLAGPGAQPFDIVLRMDGLGSFAEEARQAQLFTLRGIRVMVRPLARILASKEAANRPKDRLIIPLLRDALLTEKERRRRSG